MRMISFILLFALIILTISFALLNAQTVSINYFLGIKELPLSLLLLLALVLGCILCGLVQFKVLLKQRYEIHTLNKKIARLTQEVNNLRVLPVQDTEL
jgi:lipopolysaccharide assembly protein A